MDTIDSSSNCLSRSNLLQHNIGKVFNTIYDARDLYKVWRRKLCEMEKTEQRISYDLSLNNSQPYLTEDELNNLQGEYKAVVNIIDSLTTMLETKDPRYPAYLEKQSLERERKRIEELNKTEEEKRAEEIQQNNQNIFTLFDDAIINQGVYYVG